MQRTIPTQLLQDRRIHMLLVSHLDNSQASIIMDSAACMSAYGCALLRGGMHASRQTSRVNGELAWKAWTNNVLVLSVPSVHGDFLQILAWQVASPMKEKKHIADKLNEKLVIGPSRRVSSCL